MELNTLMRRKTKGEVELIPALWEIENVDGYNFLLKGIAWANPPTNDPSLFLTKIIFPLLAKKFGAAGDYWDDERFEMVLLDYVDENRWRHNFPKSLEKFAEERTRGKQL